MKRLPTCHRKTPVDKDDKCPNFYELAKTSPLPEISLNNQAVRFKLQGKRAPANEAGARGDALHMGVPFSNSRISNQITLLDSLLRKKAQQSIGMAEIALAGLSNHSTLSASSLMQQISGVCYDQGSASNLSMSVNRSLNRHSGYANLEGAISHSQFSANILNDTNLNLQRQQFPLRGMVNRAGNTERLLALTGTLIRGNCMSLKNTSTTSKFLKAPSVNNAGYVQDALLLQLMNHKNKEAGHDINDLVRFPLGFFSHGQPRPSNQANSSSLVNVELKQMLKNISDDLNCNRRGDNR